MAVICFIASAALIAASATGVAVLLRIDAAENALIEAEQAARERVAIRRHGWWWGWR